MIMNPERRQIIDTYIDGVAAAARKCDVGEEEESYEIGCSEVDHKGSSDSGTWVCGIKLWYLSYHCDGQRR
ncbi:hypothetical protein AHAS_Ahas18G0203200 [Arachis hypogaea]